MVSVRRGCEALGIDEDAQQVKLKQAPRGRTLIIKAHDTQNHVQQQLTTEHKTLPMWLATIHTSKVNADLRPLLLKFQTEARDVLAAWFLDQIPFHGDTIEAIKLDGKILVSLNRVCNSLGIAPQPQQRKLKPLKWPGLTSMVAPDERVRPQQLTMIDLESLAPWL